jgi:hypothetical protein
MVEDLTCSQKHNCKVTQLLSNPMNAKVVGHTSAGAFHEMMASHLQCRHASFLGNAFVPLLLKTNKIDSLNKPKYWMLFG